MGDLPLRTPTHRRLGGPLHRQLTNATHAHPLPITLSPLRDVPKGVYAVLGGISSGYPAVKGRLHTCYSPVRRSPTVESKLSTSLPLDLHVLSLSLAFILSQDQTLRCCYLVLFLFQNFVGFNRRSGASPPALPNLRSANGSSSRPDPVYRL